MEASKEALIIIKTKDSLYGKLKVLIENNHPYSVPEIIAIDIDKINPKYLEWVNREVNAQPYSQ
ncbi:MAG: divalent cation tolerance protein CutA [Candidatus Omnitrophica bacterium]|nr:divalent cation tolerance protein CutA [Candidatus Omnitrophota bacterium]